MVRTNCLLTVARQYGITVNADGSSPAAPCYFRCPAGVSISFVGWLVMAHYFTCGKLVLLVLLWPTKLMICLTEFRVDLEL